MRPSKKNVLAFMCLLSSMIFYCQENGNGLDGIRKNAVSVSFFGTTGFIGITYGRVLSKTITAEVGIGYPGFGLGIKIYPFSIKQNKMMFATGMSVTKISGISWSENNHDVILYLPIGMSYFGSKRFNFGIDVGPAILMESVDTNEFGAWASLKLGMWF